MATNIPHVADLRDKNYTVAGYLATVNTNGRKLLQRNWGHGCIGNQGMSSQCTAFATWGMLQAHPKPLAVEDIPAPEDIYAWCQAQPGEAASAGVYDRTILDYLRKSGLIKAYYWSQDHSSQQALLDECVAALLYVGPVIAFMRWPAAEPVGGKIINAGGIVGDHAVLLVGVEMERGLIYGVNSYGEKWGDRGTFTISFRTLSELLVRAIAAVK